MPYLGKSPSFGVRQRYQYTATAGQTTFSGADTDSLTLNYTDNNFVDVFQNGVLLKGGGTDYTATSGTSVVLATGASVSDVIEIIVYDVFSVGNFYSRTDSDSRYLNVAGDTMTGSLDLNGTELILDADADTSITADTDDQIDVKVAGTDQITIKDGAVSPVTNNDIDLGTSSLSYKDIYLDGELKFNNFEIGDQTIDANSIQFRKADGTQKMIMNPNGTVGISTDGSNFTTSGDSGGGLVRGFTVQHDSATNFAAEIRSEGNNANRYGLTIAYGADDNHSSTAIAISFTDGDGTSQGQITSTNGTVNYGTFTANHDCYLPDADKQTGYPYGTLLECVGTTYKKSVGTGTTLERGIQYNVQKTSSKGTNAVMGAYANRYSTFYEHGDTIPEGKVIGDEKVVDKPLHQVYILGDGHILCNNSGGNISIGDFIVASATAGIGMKADASGMACGIARENISFSSSSETKLVAVEYGLRQYIHS